MASSSSASYCAHDVGDAPETLSELPRPHPETSTLTRVAISTSYNRTPSSISQDVRSVVNSSTSYLSSPVTRSDAFSHYLGPSVSSSSTTPSQHVLTTRRQRPRTSNKVFTAHGTIAPNGLPKSLPPAPSTAPRRTQPEPELSDFFALSNNYLNMLKSKDNSMVNTTAIPSAPEAPAFRPEDVQSIFDVITGDLVASDDEADSDSDSFSGSSSTSMLPPPTPQTPELWSSPAWSDAHDFGVCSPDTDLLNTPLFGDEDMLTGMIEGEGFEGGALFPSMDQFPEFFEKTAPQPAPPLPENLFTFTPESPALHDFSPTVNPTSLHPSPLLPVDHTFPSPAPSTPLHAFPPVPPASVSNPSGVAPVIRRKTSATGTRKGVTPGALVPIDAPTQPRRYAMPSMTSRKELPTTFAKKRARSTAFGEEDEDGIEPPPGPDATEREQIEYKRRQNTVAARRSRKRKLEHQQFLESEVERLTRERDEWKTRADVCVAVLQSKGIPFPPFQD
ncbi:hypothetical protein H0H92_012573 [Tricholoma furcatifolium]|nr:hypothetical protein H0H92_012573 [Tricholoma furcatifolium]